MKKILLIIALIFTTIVAFSQARLGSSATEIKSEFSGSHYKLIGDYTNDKTYYIGITTERATVLYYFNSDMICNRTLIVPNNQGALNYYVELYNKHYVIINSTRWKMYSAGGIANIELFYPQDGGYCFVWSD